MLIAVGTPAALGALHDLLTFIGGDIMRAHIRHAAVETDEIFVVPTRGRIGVHIHIMPRLHDGSSCTPRQAS